MVGGYVYMGGVFVWVENVKFFIEVMEDFEVFEVFGGVV